jgi:hypothetical protein
LPYSVIDAKWRRRSGVVITTNSMGCTLRPEWPGGRHDQGRMLSSSTA